MRRRAVIVRIPDYNMKFGITTNNVSNNSRHDIYKSKQTCLFVYMQSVFGYAKVIVPISTQLQIKITSAHIVFHPYYQQQLNKLDNSTGYKLMSCKNLMQLLITIFHGTMRDITFLYRRRLYLSGVGFRACREGSKLSLTIGYSYTVEIWLPKDIDVKVVGRKSRNFVIYGMARDRVEDMVFLIRSIHPPDSYTSQGIMGYWECKNFVLKPGKKQAPYSW